MKSILHCVVLCTKLENLNNIVSLKLEIKPEYINHAKAVCVGNIIILTFATQSGITIPQNLDIIAILDIQVEEQKFVVSDYQSSGNTASRCSLTNSKIRFPNGTYKSSGASYGQVITHIKN